MTIYPKLKSLLLDTGLSETESAVYIELLKSPAQTIWELKGRVGSSKSAVYRAFERLRSLNLVEKSQDGICALSLKHLVADLSNESRKLNKTVNKIKEIAPFLRTPGESIDHIDFYYTPDQIAEAYLFMAEQDYNVNLDFGDFENFINSIGGMEHAYNFQNTRMKHATNRALCTTYGPNTEYFCTREAKEKFQNYVDVLDANFHGNFIIFSDNSDYVLFNNFEDQENPNSVLVKSRLVADMQRRQFDAFSQQAGNC